MKYLALIGTTLLFTSCVSTKSTIKNIDNSAIRPSYANEMYLITEYAEDSNYGFDADYPINIGFIQLRTLERVFHRNAATVNQIRTKFLKSRTSENCI
jgi:hypothetical protein